MPHPIRWGLAEGEADAVTNYDRPLGPVCLTKGTSVKARCTAPNALLWKVGHASLKSKVTGTVYWSWLDPGIGNMVARDVPITLGSLPDSVDWCELTVQHSILLAGMQFYISLPQTTEVFVVFGAAVGPMAAGGAWVNVLRHACNWGQGATSPGAAGVKLTEALFHAAHYYEGGMAYTRWEAGNQIFYLRGFLEDTLRRAGEASRFPWGQCDDFADFLLSMEAAVGGRETCIQRTNPEPGDQTAVIFTKSLKRPGDPSFVSRNWRYHQFTEYTSCVWDPTVVFPPDHEHPAGMGRDYLYQNTLVDYYLPGYGWAPPWTAARPVTEATPPVPPLP